jgi:hypothetical protein
MTIGRWVIPGMILAASSAAAAGAQETTAPEWQPGGRESEYVESMFGLPAIVDVGLATALDQLRDNPEEWDQDIEGLGKRVASNAGRNTVEESVRHGLAALMDRSVNYEPCTCADFGGRVWNAVLETVTDRDQDGDRLPAIPRLAGATVGAFAESAWQPGEDNNDVLRVATRSLLFGTLGSLWKEFVGWP